MNQAPRTKNPNRALLAAFLLSSFVIPHSSFAADSPLYIPFQGQVTNQAGSLSPDGQYSVIFNLYEQAVGGQPVWSERHVKIGVSRGMINVFLGSISPLTAVDFSQTKYLGITVDTDNLATTADPEMVPRSLIMPAFHAKKAENSTKLAGFDWSAFMTSNNPSTALIQNTRIATNSINTAQVIDNAVTTAKIADSAVTGAKLADGLITTAKFADTSITTAKLAAAVAEALVPPGTILPYGGATAPGGYLLCDGAAYSRTGLYAGLYGKIFTNYGAPDSNTFNVPDLRGQFLRGAIRNLQANCTGSAATNNVTTTATHPFNRTGMRVKVTGTLPTGLVLNTTYFIINVSPTSLAFASTQENALSGTKIAITGAVGGMLVTQDEDPDASLRLAGALGGATGNAVGSVQADEFKSHTHGHGSHSAITYSADPTTSAATAGDRRVPQPEPGAFRTLTTGGNETRPKNAYVNYIIKY